MARVDTAPLLARLLTTLGLGSSFVGAVTACGGSDDIAQGATDAGFETRTGMSPPDSAGDVELRKDAPADVVAFDQFLPPSPPPLDAAVDCWSLLVTRAEPAPNVCPTAEDGGIRSYLCFRPPPIGATCESAYGDECLLKCGGAVACGPMPSPDNRCCYVFLGGCPARPQPPGRPFIVGGEPRIAPVTADASWAHDFEQVAHGLDGDTRAALADVWTKDALTEHASVASFSRFVLQCLALGAPADIVAAAQQACADEIEHARIGFGLASAYAGRPVGPGRLDISGALADSLDPAEIACSVAREGCIAEMVSAAIIAAARDEARHPVVRKVLARMAEQELEHALLAWRYLGWALESGGARLRQKLAQIFAEMERHVAAGAVTSLPACPETMRAHGYVAPHERRLVARAVTDEVIRKAARALLHGETPPVQLRSS